MSALEAGIGSSQSPEVLLKRHAADEEDNHLVAEPMTEPEILGPVAREKRLRVHRPAEERCRHGGDASFHVHFHGPGRDQDVPAPVEHVHPPHDEPSEEACDSPDPEDHVEPELGVPSELQIKGAHHGEPELAADVERGAPDAARDVGGNREEHVGPESADPAEDLPLGVAEVEPGTGIVARDAQRGLDEVHGLTLAAPLEPSPAGTYL